jgi:hypothetical protein
MIYGKFSIIDLLIYLRQIKTIEDVQNNNFVKFIDELKKNKFTKKDQKNLNDLAIKICEKKLMEIK